MVTEMILQFRPPRSTRAMLAGSLHADRRVRRPPGRRYAEVGPISHKRNTCIGAWLVPHFEFTSLEVAGLMTGGQRVTPHPS